MDTKTIENTEFAEMIIHLKNVVERNGIKSRSGISAARQIEKIGTIRKIKAEAIKIQEREGAKNERVCTT